jgi:hypothetical protein
LENVFAQTGNHEDWIEFQSYKNIGAIIDAEDVVKDNIGKLDMHKSN